MNAAEAQEVKKLLMQSNDQYRRLQVLADATAETAALSETD